MSDRAYEQEMTEAEFEAEFKPLEAPNGSLVWHIAELFDADIPVERTWTLVDGDTTEATYALPGIHAVNAWGYAVTETPWTDPDRVAVWAEAPDA